MTEPAASSDPAALVADEESESPPGLRRRWRLDLAYDGAAFHGFAAQPGVATVAGSLAEALGRALRTDAPQLVCAGRTDTGVHARAQVVHVELADPLALGQRASEPDEAAALVKVLNRALAPAIVVHRALPVPDTFDARRSARSRTYRYLVWNAPAPDPLWAPLSWHVPGALDRRAMDAAADTLIGEHDFRSMCRRAPGTTADDPIVRVVRRAAWHEERSAEVFDAEGAVLLRFEIEAGSFCHQMVRSIVAHLVEVGLGRLRVAELVGRLRSAVRHGSPQPAPARGLCLVGVAYDDARTPGRATHGLPAPRGRRIL
jgi:tRNA pseudouridine38-40 synthase